MVTRPVSFSIGRTGRILLVVAFGVAAAASASAGQITAEQRAACTPDAVRLCSSEIPDVARVTACMKAKQASLSSRCRAAFASANISETTTVRVSHVAPMQRARGVSQYTVSHVNHVQPQLHQHRWARSGRGLRIARQVISGFAMACGTQALPAEICNGSFLSSGALSSSGFSSGLLSSGVLNSDLLSSGLVSSFLGQ
jgi:hypothetical protein